jgi:hypothetical protein
MNVQVTIPAGQNLSSEGVLGLGWDTCVGIRMPSAWSPAPLSFLVDLDDGAGYSIVDDGFGAELTVPGNASRYIPLDPALFSGVRRLKVRSGTSGTPVNQGADRTITLVTRPV